jgi:hypothetical protein
LSTTESLTRSVVRCPQSLRAGMAIIAILKMAIGIRST